MAVREYIVRGRVQGVGFRYHTHAAALQTGVRGYVRNQSDGSVQVVAQGDAAQLAALEAFLRRGPRWADVGEVEARDLEDAREFSAFAIRY